MTTRSVRKGFEATVIRLCKEIASIQRRRDWRELKEADLLFELVATILGSQVSYEMAKAAADRLYSDGLLTKKTYKQETKLHELIEKSLRKPIFHSHWGEKGRRYRFPKLRACQINRTMNKIYSQSSLKNILSKCSYAGEARAELVRTVLGIGPKQASLFLRNVGYTGELAILDIHVLRYMNFCGMSDISSSPSKISEYEILENRLLEYSFELGVPLGCLDQAIWVTMRVAGKEALI